MAQMGLKRMYWAPIEKETDSAAPTYKKDGIIEVGKAVSLNVKINNSEGELYANDMLVEYAGEFSSADLTVEVDNISLENQATLLGAKYEEQEGFTANANDTAPYGGVGGYQVLQVNGKRVFRCWHYTKTKAIMPDLEGNTKGNNISFAAQSLKMKVTSPAFGAWYKAKEFENEAEADKWIQTQLGKSDE